MIQPSASSGQTSCSSGDEHELADRQLARDHVAAAEERTAAIPSEGGEEARGGSAPRPTPLASSRGGRLGPAEEARAHVLLAAERLHHLDPDDRLVRRLGEVALPRLHEPRDREEPVCEEKVRIAIGGIASAAEREPGVHGTSTIAAPVIIIALWIPGRRPSR